MSGLWWLLLVVAGSVYVFLKVRKPAIEPLSENDRQCIARLPCYCHLNLSQQQRLHQQVGVFLATTSFYGCNGLEVDRDMAISIAAMACLLSLRDSRPYPWLRSVLVYPDAFEVRDQQPDQLGLVDDVPQSRIGESWDGQRIVLSWPDAQLAWHGVNSNVIAHECAHQLDSRGIGCPDGVASHAHWAAVMRRAYAELCSNGSPVIDAYGRTSPAEFFAVVVEAYLQDGVALAHFHPEVYQLLLAHFQLDLAAGQN